VTVDTVTQDVHFSLDFTPWADLGWKALAVNLSDIAAMGGTPRYALVALALPGKTEADDVLALYGGMLALAGQHGVTVVGGNVSRAPSVSLTVTVTGVLENDRNVLRRSAARPGDKIAVTGCLGGAAAGLRLLREGRQITGEADAALRQAFLRPVPRVAEGQMLARQGVAAAIDISDGLAADLGHVCRASRVSATIRAEDLPVCPGVRENFAEAATALALGGGEDYELLFTASDAVIEKVAKAAGCPVTVIGEIGEGDLGTVRVVDGSGKDIPLPEKGWEHFRSP
ncbi:MAG: thiamine-phosphate kinase, partial [Chloroflexota bacterium]